MDARWRRPLVVSAFAMPVVALLAVRLVGLNRDDAYSFLVNYDVQGADQGWDDFYTSTVWVFTSGFAAGQFVALLIGAMLVFADRANAYRRLPENLVTAVCCGVLMAAANLATVFAMSPPTVPSQLLLHDMVAQGFVVDTNVWHHPGLTRALVFAVVAYPLWAAIGVGLAALLNRWVALTLVLVLVLLVASGYRFYHPVVNWFVPSTSDFLVTKTLADDRSGPGELFAVIGVTLAWAVVLFFAGRWAARRRQFARAAVRQVVSAPGPESETGR